MKKVILKTTVLAFAIVLTMGLCIGLSACGGSEGGDSETTEKDGNTLVYGSGDYTRINPAIDEHGEINLLLFDGLMGHDENNQVVPALAESYELDEATNTYTFKLREDVKWHDGEPFTAEDVKFTIEAIMDPENESEIFSNYEDVEEITTDGDYQISFKLKDPNYAFLEYMTIGILPNICLKERACRRMSISGLLWEQVRTNSTRGMKAKA